MELAVEAFAYATNLGDERTRALSAPGAAQAAVEIASGLPRRARKQLHRAALLAIDAATRCTAHISEAQREQLPLFAACATGVDLARPYLEASHAARHEALGGGQEAWLLDGNAGSVLEYIKGLAGNLPGHVAMHTGVRGPSACFTGFNADYCALRKAALVLARGASERVLVVCAEVLADTATETHTAMGVALSVTRVAGHVRSTGAEAAAARWTLELSESERAPGEPGRFRQFEACSLVANVLCAIEGATPVQLSLRDRWQRTLHCRVRSAA